MMNVVQFENAKEKRMFFKDQAIERIGETRLNNYGSLMTVDEYRDSKNQGITVRFIESGYMVNASWSNFISGSIKNPYDKSIFGVGYLGEGKYKPSENGVYTQQYKTWQSMLMRCYSEKFQEKNPSYKGCTVSEEFHNFQNFGKWFDENYYEIDGARMNLDKDILVKGNKVYSPDTCVFVPHFINLLFVKRESKRGNLPIGVKIPTHSPKKFEARCNESKGYKKYLGTFDTAELAFNAYKEYKEQIIKKVAEEHKDVIPHALYNALINYEVEIDD